MKIVGVDMDDLKRKTTDLSCRFERSYCFIKTKGDFDEISIKFEKILGPRIPSSGMVSKK